MHFLSRITSPLVNLLSASTDLGLRLLGIQPGTEPPVTEEEIKVLMEQGTQVGVFEAAEQDMIEGVFRLSDRYIDAIMTPRTEIEWLDLEESMDEILADIMNSNHSRFPAGIDNLDNVQGILRRRLFESLFSARPFGNSGVLQRRVVPDSLSGSRCRDDQRSRGRSAGAGQYGGLSAWLPDDMLKAATRDYGHRGGIRKPGSSIRR